MALGRSRYRLSVVGYQGLRPANRSYRLSVVWIFSFILQPSSLILWSVRTRRDFLRLTSD
jgi:hypothetical protein